MSEEKKLLSELALEAIEQSQRMMSALIDGLHEHPEIEADPVFKNNQVVMRKLRIYIAKAKT